MRAEDALQRCASSSTVSYLIASCLKPKSWLNSCGRKPVVHPGLRSCCQDRERVPPCTAAPLHTKAIGLGSLSLYISYLPTALSSVSVSFARGRLSLREESNTRPHGAGGCKRAKFKSRALLREERRVKKLLCKLRYRAA